MRLRNCGDQGPPETKIPAGPYDGHSKPEWKTARNLRRDQDEREWLNTALIKQHTGDLELKGRYMRQDNITFKTTHTLILMTNDLPIIEDQSSAWWERLQMLEWYVKIESKAQDLQLQKKLKAEWSYILGYFRARWKGDAGTADN